MKRLTILRSIATIFLFAAISGADDFAGSALWNHPHDIRTDGHYAYCAFASGLTILDISEPSSPSLSANLIILGSTTDIDVSGNFAFLADKRSGLKIVNIMNRSHPFLIGTRQTPGRAFDISISGQYAFVIDVDSGLFVFDIADPYNVSLEGNATGQYFTNVFVAGDHAYVIWFYGLIIYDVADPAHPYQRGSFTTYPVLPRDVFVTDTLAYLVTDEELLILDVSDKWSPTVIGSWQAKTACTSIIVSGNYAYISERPYGLSILDVSDPQYPFLIGTYEQDVSWPEIAVDGEIVYLADADTDLLAIDIADRFDPALAGAYPTRYYVENVAVLGDHAYVVDKYFGIRVLEISDPAAPEIVGGWTKPDSIVDIVISGSYCYLIDELSRLEILDLSNPRTPELTASISIPGVAASLFVEEGRAFIAAGPEGLQIVDISDPENPLLLNGFDTEHQSDRVVVSGDYAALRTNYRRQILLVNISNREIPILFGIFESQYAISDFHLSGDDLLVAGDSSIRIFQIDNSRDPVSFDLLGETLLDHETARLSVADDRAFISHARDYLQDYTCEISVVDISNPSRPVFTGGFSTPGSSHGLRTSDGYLYIADGYSLLILQAYIPTGVHDETSYLPGGFPLSQNYPNPFNAQTTISYDLPTAGYVRLEIYDILGRKIETLINDFQPPDSHAVAWSAGSHPSGVYFYRLKAGDQAETKSCLLLK